MQQWLPYISCTYKNRGALFENRGALRDQVAASCSQSAPRVLPNRRCKFLHSKLDCALASFASVFFSHLAASPTGVHISRFSVSMMILTCIREITSPPCKRLILMGKNWHSTCYFTNTKPTPLRKEADRNHGNQLASICGLLLHQKLFQFIPIQFQPFRWPRQPAK